MGFVRVNFKLQPGMIVKHKVHGAICIILSVGCDDYLSYRTQMYVLKSRLLVDLGCQKTFWVNSIMADDKYEVLYECPAR